MNNLSPPPIRDPDFTSHAWQRWFSSIYALFSQQANGNQLISSAESLNQARIVATLRL